MARGELCSPVTGPQGGSVLALLSSASWGLFSTSLVAASQPMATANPKGGWAVEAAVSQEEEQGRSLLRCERTDWMGSLCLCDRWGGSTSHLSIEEKGLAGTGEEPSGQGSARRPPIQADEPHHTGGRWPSSCSQGSPSPGWQTLCTGGSETSWV